jgi:putative membrane protein
MKRLNSGPVVVFLAVAVAGATIHGQSQSGNTGSRQADRPATGSPSGSSTGSPTGNTGPTTARTGDNTSMPHSDARGFINEMAIAGMAEVQLGQMAATKASNADVKSFGQMMVTDHSKANDELKQVASQMQVQVPVDLDQKHKALADRLSRLQGAEFDREYMTAMVQGHEEVASKLRSHAGNGVTSHDTSSHDRQSSASGSSASAAQSRSTGSSTTSRQAATSAAGDGHAAAGDAAGEQAVTQWASKTLPAVQQHLQKAREIQQKLK